MLRQVSNQVGRRHIAPLLARFADLHPEIQVQLDLTDVVLDLVASGMDVAVRLGALDDSSFVSRPLATNYRVLCASPEYLRKHGSPTSPQDLAHHKCLWNGALGVVQWRLGSFSVRITPHLSSNDGDVIQGWAIGGHGIAIKSIWDVSDDLDFGRLLRVLPAHAIPAAPLHAVYPHRSELAPRVRACIDFLAAAMERIVPADAVPSATAPARTK
ncbi:MAG TPA: LysR substrate-binding domain-containing protein [Burkholderiaceae bacterium]|nr:LysR substrate-binding domain-containing protein [Burkholderiaceae bacterium]